MPERVQRRRVRGELGMPKGARYVGRGSRYGNPFKVGALVMEPGPYAGPASPYDGLLQPGAYQWTGLCGPYEYVIRPVRDRADAVALFGPYVDFHDDVWPPEAIRDELGGRDLACWCPIFDADGRRVPCHADDLIRRANPPTPELLAMVAARPFIDFPTGWALARSGVPHRSAACSYVQTGGALLCDCDAIRARWCELRTGLGLEVPADQEPSNV